MTFYDINTTPPQPMIASVMMDNFRHVNYGKDLLPVDFDGIATDGVINIGGASSYFNQGYFKGLTIAPTNTAGGQVALNIYDFGSGSGEGGAIQFSTFGHSEMAKLGAISESIGGGLGFWSNPANSGAPNLNMILNGSGNLGVGTSSPLGRLDVNITGSGYIDGVLIRKTASPTLSVTPSTAGAVHFTVANTAPLGNESSDFINSMTLIETGHVVIGRDTASLLYDNSLTTLNVAGKTSTKTGGIVLDDVSSALKFSIFGDLGVSTSNPFAIGTLTNHGFRFIAKNTAVGVVTAGGNFGIGKLTPNYKLDVSAPINIDTGDVSGLSLALRIYDYGVGSGEGGYILFENSDRLNMAKIAGYSEGAGGGLAFYTNSQNSGEPAMAAFLNYGGNFGVGTMYPNAKIHAMGQSTQLKIGYDDLTFAISTVNSSGNVNYDALGASPMFIFNKPLSVPNQPNVGVYRATGQDVGTAFTPLFFSDEDYDTGDMHSTALNPSRVTALIAGKYLVIAHVRTYSGIYDHIIEGYIYKNGQQVRGSYRLLRSNSGSGTGTYNDNLHFYYVIELLAGDYVEIWVKTDSGTVTFTPNQLQVVKLF